MIIPTFRRPEAVRAAAQSALLQTWSNVEVIVVADGPDAAAGASLAGLDPRLHYLELPTNQGPAAARNAGVAASRGQWLSFLDDDDLMLANKIEMQMRLADPGRPEQMISCRTVYRQGGREDIWPSRPIAPHEDLAEYLLTRPSLFGRPGTLPIQSLLIHRSILREIPFALHEDHEDWAWLLKAWHQLAARVVFAWEPLVIYHIDTDAISRSRRLNWADSLAWAQEHRRWMSDRAFCSFLATKVALKARRAGDWRGFGEIARIVLRNRPGPLEMTFLAGMALLPESLLHGAWTRSLRSTQQLAS